MMITILADCFDPNLEMCIIKQVLLYAGTNISNENLLFVAQFDSKGVTSIFALDDQYRCRLAITPTSSNQISWV